MSDKPTIADIMAAYATDAVEHARAHFGTELDYSEQSVRAVEEILAKLRAAVPTGIRRWFRRPPSPEVVATFSKMYGGYVGEVFRRARGGEWQVRNDIPGSPGAVIAFSAEGGDTFFPPARVFKRLTEGDADNVWFYYQVLTSRTDDPAV